MRRPFISFTSADRPFVEGHLAPSLRNAGIEPWFFTEAIAAGDVWRNEISEALDEADGLLVVISANSLARVHKARRENQTDWMMVEVALALKKKLPVIPVELDGTQADEIALELIVTQAIRFDEGASMHERALHITRNLSGENEEASAAVHVPQPSEGDRYIVVSHSSADRASAALVRDALRAHGILVWEAPLATPTGTSLRELRRKAIAECAAMVVLTSQNANVSLWVQGEVIHARSGGHPMVALQIDSTGWSTPLSTLLTGVEKLDVTSSTPAQVLRQLSDHVAAILA